MSNTKEVHYDLNPIDSLNATINVIYGERSNGKSYQVKHKKMVEKYLNTGKRFILLRREKQDISSDKVERYFSDVNVIELTGGRYNCIIKYRQEIFFAFYDMETGKTNRGEKIGYVMALVSEQTYAGCSYLDVEDIVFEEFMAREPYLHDEPDKLINLRSTVDRKRNIVKLWLVGNTLSRVCPYLKDWGLLDIVKKQKQGTIETVDLPTNTFDETGKEITLKCAVEYCRDTGKSSFAIGKHRDMLNKGDWQSDPQPHLPKSYKKYKVIFRMIFVFQEFKFKNEYLFDPITKENCWFISPYEGEIDDHTVVISDTVKMSRYWQRDIYNTDFRNESLNKLLYTFRESNIFYATDLCGTEFKQAIDFTIKK